MSQIRNMRRRHRIERLQFGEKILGGYILGVQKLLYLGAATHPDPEVSRAFDSAFARAVELVGRDPFMSTPTPEAPAAAPAEQPVAQPPAPALEPPPKVWPQLCSYCGEQIMEPENYTHPDPEDLSIVRCEPCGMVRTPPTEVAAGETANG